MPRSSRGSVCRRANTVSLECFNPSPGSAVAQPLGWVNLACGAGEEAQCFPGYVPSHLAMFLRNSWFRELCVWWGRGAGRPASKNKMFLKDMKYEFPSHLACAVAGPQGRANLAYGGQGDTKSVRLYECPPGNFSTMEAIRGSVCRRACTVSLAKIWMSRIPGHVKQDLVLLTSRMVYVGHTRVSYVGSRDHTILSTRE